ncbi:MAG: MoxR family ATPase [Firmicutes bacterium]|nr:MoxR family ATPase [Bacillota bacterium]
MPGGNLHDMVQNFLDAVDRVVVGKREQSRIILAAWLAEGHVLLEDVPGVAKTRLARTFAQLTNLSFARVQGTPDLLPQDITGGAIYDLKTGQWQFRPGPVFHHILLVDEINRTSPRTQAALLECMEERQVTQDGISHPLPAPFLVVATQNPIEMEGTFPLPEAELDRFLVSLSLGYPSATEERTLVQAFSQRDPLPQLGVVLDAEQLRALSEAAKSVNIGEATLDYLVDLCRASREHPAIRLGVSPRTTVRFAQLLRAYALLLGRDFVTPDDVKALAPYVFSHRLVLSQTAVVSHRQSRAVVEELLNTVPVPVERVP